MKLKKYDTSNTQNSMFQLKKVHLIKFYLDCSQRAAQKKCHKVLSDFHALLCFSLALTHTSSKAIFVMHTAYKWANETFWLHIYNQSKMQLDHTPYSPRDFKQIIWPCTISIRGRIYFDISASGANV